MFCLLEAPKHPCPRLSRGALAMVRHRLSAVVGETVQVGQFDATDRPVLTVNCCDEIDLQTLSLWGGRVTADMSADDVWRVRSEHSGAGPHSLTGPIAVRGARVGDVVRIKILGARPARHGFNVVSPGTASRGVLADRFPAGFVRHFTVDDAGRTAQSGRISVPINPFPGFIAVAAPRNGPHSSIEPGRFGGNLDIKDLVPGATLLLPVFRDKALIWVGDGHLAQGNGEVDGTAIEAGLDSIRIQIGVERGLRLHTPRWFNADHLASIGLARNLDTAVRSAVADMVDWLGELGVAQEDAYLLCSVGAEMSVSQVVNGVKGVHFRLAHALIPADVQFRHRCP